MRLFLALLVTLLLFQCIGSRTGNTASFYANDSNARLAHAGQQTAELDEARQLNQKVVQLFSEGKIDEALPIAKRVLQIREKALGRDDQLVVEALLNLAELKLYKSFYRESLSLYERILKS